MAAPLLKTLSARARLASPFIRRGVRQGLSFNQIRSVLREEGLGLTVSELSPIVKSERALRLHGENLRYLPFNARPDPRKLPVSITSMRRRYAYNVEVYGYSAKTGETMARYITVSTDTLLTRGEAEDAAAESILSEFDNYGMEIDRTQLRFVQESSLYRPFG